MRIHVDHNPDPGQTLKSQKGFLHLQNFPLYFFLQFLVIKTLDPDLDPDSLKMLDPQHWLVFSYCKCAKKLLF